MERMKVRAFDGTWVEAELDPLPCGGVPEFDEDSGCAYYCDICGAVVGSLGMPAECRDAWNEQREKEAVWTALERK